MLAHSVYFTLRDKSPEAADRLVRACRTLLCDHPGTVFFGAGPLAEEFQRDVNDRHFDVALQLVFTDKAAHDQYQASARHQQFVADNKDSWSQVRVFDAYVSK